MPRIDLLSFLPLKSIALVCGVLLIPTGQLAAQKAETISPAFPETKAEQEAESAAAADDAQAEPAGEETTEQRNQRFAAYMSGAKLVGRFTLMDAAEKMPSEEYVIRKCEALPDGKRFRFTVRIRYGEVDTELPMDLPVEWAGKTPVITLEELWIPGLGTFSSRVVIHHGRYAGTWDHGEKGGHLFGKIIPAAAAQEPPAN